MRAVRVIQILERMGSAGALEVLVSLAKGAAASNLTREARRRGPPEPQALIQRSANR